MKPTDKAPEINEFLKALLGDNREQAINEKRCIIPPIGCGKPVLDLIDPSRVEEGAFRDELSVREFTISGFCQRCQDKIFVEPEEDGGDEDDDELDGPAF